MRKVICDRCGRDISDHANAGYISVVWRPIKGPDELSENPYEDYDFCEDCLKDIVRVIDFKEIAVVPEDPEDEEPGADPDPGEPAVKEKEPSRKRKAPAQLPEPKKMPVDPEKLRELVKAGKKTKEIAEFFGIPESSAYNYVRAFKREFNQGFTGGGILGGAGNALNAGRSAGYD